jgi:hypothetical protein
LELAVHMIHCLNPSLGNVVVVAFSYAPEGHLQVSDSVAADHGATQEGVPGPPSAQVVQLEEVLL